MKLKIFALMLALVLALSCFVACGNTTDSKDTDGKDSAVDPDTNAITDISNDTYPSVDGGKIFVDAKIVGNQLIANVCVDGNPGLAAFNIQLHYDNTKIRPVEITDSELVDVAVIASNIMQDPEVIPELTYATAFYANPSNFTGNGVLFSMTFDVLEGASGESELSLVCEEGSNANQDFEVVIFELQPCTVNFG